MKRTLLIILGLAIVLAIAIPFIITKVHKELAEAGKPAPQEALGKPVPFLTVPEGFKATYYATGVESARVMEFDPKGRMLVSQTQAGKVGVLEDNDGDGVAESLKTLVDGLDQPHGIVVRCDDPNNSLCDLYVATHRALLKYAYNTTDATLSDKRELLSLSYAPTDRHKTRTLMFLPAPDDSKLLISVGSSCNVCHDTELRGKIISYDIGTGKVSEYATGLRNSVFMTLHPANGMVFATEMGRDGLGDDTPPDEVNRIDPGYGIPQNFGWPTCYGKNMHDTEFDKNTYIQNPCMMPFQMPSWLDLQAHSAPLGLSFIPEEGWPEDMWFDLLIAYHGSWDRSVPTGYKIVKVDVNGKGDPSAPEDFITGWIESDGTKHGRPAGILALPGGVIYISDDGAGAIYKISRVAE